MHSKLRIALALFAALAAPMAVDGSALAQSARPDLGMAIMSANVHHDGTLIGGAGAVGATRRANGLYFVAFNRSVEGCTHVGAVGGPLAFLYAGFVSTEAHPDTLNGATYYGLSVTTANPSGLSDDQPFHLIVFCSQ